MDRQFTANFAESTLQTLEELAMIKGASIGDTLRDAIALEKWL